MDDKKGASLLSFLNLLSSDFGTEDFQSLKDAKQFLPIFVEFVKTGQLFFAEQRNFSIHTAFSDIEAATGEKLCDSLLLGSHLSVDEAENDDIELAKVILALILSLRILYVNKFNEFIQRLDKSQAHILDEMMYTLLIHRGSAELPLVQVLSSHPIENGMPMKKLSASANAAILHNNSNNLEIFSSPIKSGVIGGISPSDSPSKQSADEEEIANHKIRSTEMNGRLKQLEKENQQLLEQFNIAQEDYHSLNTKYEKLLTNNTKLQDNVRNLSAKLKEAQDDTEMKRYENEQLKREQKNGNEKHAKEMDKQAKDVKEKEKELKLLHLRLDDYAEKFAAKEALDSRVKFMDQQLVNQQGMQLELREEMEKALNRANIAENELASFKKSMEDRCNQLESEKQHLELSLDKAATVIEQYSAASEKHCSAAELLQVQHELTKSQSENQQLLNKMDQFKHQATQEQRLISAHWYSTHIQLTKAREKLRSLGLGGSTNEGGSNSMTASSTSDNNNGQQHPSTTAVQHSQRHVSPGALSSAADDSAMRRSSNSNTNALKVGGGGTAINSRSFFRRQIDTATSSPTSGGTAAASLSNVSPPSSLMTTHPSIRWWTCFKLFTLFLCSALFFSWFMGLEIEINYDYAVSK